MVGVVATTTKSLIGILEQIAGRLYFTLDRWEMTIEDFKSRK
jgi:hypothetical protein